MLLINNVLACWKIFTSGVCVCKFFELHFHTANRGNGRFRGGFCPLRGSCFGVKKGRFFVGLFDRKSCCFKRHFSGR